MKAIAAHCAPGQWPVVDIIPDSALVLHGNPLFIPDFAMRWHARIYLAVHICRLGKAISERFAHRYYDSATLALRAVPETDAPSAGLMAAFDNCLLPGAWLELLADAGSLDIAGDGFSVTVDDFRGAVDRAIADVSRFVTLRTGDMLMPVHFDLPQLLEPDMVIDATINGIPALHARLK